LSRDQDLERYRVYQERFSEVLNLLTRAREDLRTLYASAIDRERMRREKAAIYAALRKSYSDLKHEWGGHAPFDSWFEGEINNAHLASIATYYACVPGFRRELAAAGGDLGDFYARVRQLAKIDQRERDALLCGAR
jgi:predicted aminopeptidase